MLLLKTLRVHQYSKNLLILLPWILAHQWGDTHSLLLTILGIISFSLLASGTYIFNDLLDIEADRKHHSK